MDHFFEFLNVEELGSSKTVEPAENTAASSKSASVKATQQRKAQSSSNLSSLSSSSSSSSTSIHTSNQLDSRQIEYISTQLKLDTFKSKEAILHHEQKSTANSTTTATTANAGGESNLNETTANLEMSLKNSAELLKQISSIGKMEHLQQLEQQMKQSMQLIEKLKSASQNSVSVVSVSPQPPLNHSVDILNNQVGVNSNSTSMMTPSSVKSDEISSLKLRTINSMPCNLKELETLIQNQQLLIDSQNNRFQQDQMQANKQQQQEHQQIQQKQQMYINLNTFNIHASTFDFDFKASNPFSSFAYLKINDFFEKSSGATSVF